MTITNSAMLVELNISTWTAQKAERKATEDVLTSNNAAHGAGQFKKNLMAGTLSNKAIADFAQQCRAWHAGRTLPWLDKGGRLLPTSLFFPYKSEANAKRDKFNQMVDEFLVEYPTLVGQAQANLGTLFNSSDYPTADEVKAKFGFRLVFSPVPEAGDFRLDVGERDLEELKSQYEESFHDRLQEATASSWQRLHDLLKGMSAKLTDEADEEKSKRYHASLLDNAHELCGMLTHLNVTKDPKLEAARCELEQALVGIDIEDIRLDPGMRKHVKGDLDKLLGEYW